MPAERGHVPQGAPDEWDQHEVRSPSQEEDIFEAVPQQALDGSSAGERVTVHVPHVLGVDPIEVSLDAAENRRGAEEPARAPEREDRPPEQPTLPRSPAQKEAA